MSRRPLLLSLLLLSACQETPQEVPPPPRPDSFVHIDAGNEFTCGVTPEGQLFCWGSNAQGQLGTGTAESRNTPAIAATSAPLVAVSAGAQHACALGPAGELYCWGANDRGQLGTGDRNARSAPTVVPSNVRFAQVSAGATHTCAISSDRRMWCWGAGDHGGTGAADTADLLIPRAVETQVRFVDVAAGARHTCAVDTGGIAHCWGRNDRGQLGDASFFDRRLPGRPVFGEARFRDLEAGSTHTCAISMENRAFCWGSNAFGELGEGAPPFADGGAVTPYPVRGETGARAITAGVNFACLIDDFRSAWCWGRGNEGQLGNGSRFDYVVPHRVNAADLLSSFIPFLAVSAGLNHACALTDVGAVYCWGRGDRGQLGAGTFLYTTLPIRVLDGRTEVR